MYHGNRNRCSEIHQFFNRRNRRNTVPSGSILPASTGKSTFAIIGLVLVIISEICGIYLTKYESKKEIEMFKLHMFQILGTLYAFPVLLFILNYLSPDRYLLVFSIALTAAAVLKTVAVIAKAVYIEQNY